MKKIVLVGLLMLTPVIANAQPESGVWYVDGDAQMRYWNEDHDCTFDGCHQGWIEAFNRRTGNWAYLWFQINTNDPNHLVVQWPTASQGDWINNRENYLMQVYGMNPNSEPPFSRDPRMHRGVWCHDHAAMDRMLRDSYLNSFRGSWYGDWWYPALMGQWQAAMWGWFFQATWGFVTEGASQEWDCRL